MSKVPFPLHNYCFYQLTCTDHSSVNEAASSRQPSRTSPATRRAQACASPPLATPLTLDSVRCAESLCFHASPHQTEGGLRGRPSLFHLLSPAPRAQNTATTWKNTVIAQMRKTKSLRGRVACPQGCTPSTHGQNQAYHPGFPLQGDIFPSSLPVCVGLDST